MTKGKEPTLTDARGMGGLTALDGFNYQLWDGLARLPAWLANPAFEQMIFEGLEDLEARFFAPHAPHHRLLERFQAKGGSLSPAEVRDVLENFWQFETAYPRKSRVQTLVTPRLPPTVAWLGRDPARVRNARPFYAPFADIMAASDAELRRNLEDTYGGTLGSFIAASVDISERSLPDRDSAAARFAIELARAFPSLEPSQRNLSETFESLSALARRAIGVPLDSALLRRTVEDALGQALPIPTSFPLHIRSDRSGSAEQTLEIDASAFSGGTAVYPPPSTWAEELVTPLDRAARWLKERSVSRVALSGSYRLTTAFLLGWNLRSAVGFELEIPTRDGPWRTDDRPVPGITSQAWITRDPQDLQQNRLAVAIGVLRDPGADIEQTAGISPDAILGLHLSAPITSSREAQESVSLIKRAIDAAVARLRPAEIDLFLATPAAFAVALGHRWNALPPTQLHEFLPGTRRYVPTARL